MLNYYEDIILNLVSTLLSFVSFILTFSFHMKEVIEILVRFLSHISSRLIIIPLTSKYHPILHITDTVECHHTLIHTGYN